MFSPAPSKTEKRSSRSISGRCEILIAAQGKDEKAKIEQCSDVRLELQAYEKSFSRVAWVQGTEFEIPAVPRGKYKLVATSEEFHAQAELADIQPGQHISIQIKINSVGNR